MLQADQFHTLKLDQETASKLVHQPITRTTIALIQWNKKGMQVCKVEENLLQDCKFIVYRSPGEKQEIVRIMLETSVFEKDIVPRVSFVVVQHISTLYQVICYSISNLICITCQGRVKSIPSLLKHWHWSSQKNITLEDALDHRYIDGH